MRTTTDSDDEDDGMDEHEPGSHGNNHINRHLKNVAVLMVEMEHGLRPVNTLDNQASPMAARRIRHFVHQAAVARGPGVVPRTAPVSVLNTVSFHPSAGVTEGVVVLERDERVRALCVRLEQEGERWWIVDIAGPEGGLLPAVTAASLTGAVPTCSKGIRWSSGRINDDDDIDEEDGELDAALGT